jgi:hypothetical protein
LFFFTKTGGEMSVKTKRKVVVIPVLLFGAFITGCSPSSDEQTTTSDTLTASVPTNTPTLTQISPPIDTATLTTEPTATLVSITTFEEMEGIWSRTYRGAEFKLTINKDGGVTHIEVYFPQDVRIPEIWFGDGFLYIRETTSTCSRDQLGIYEVTGVPEEYLIFTPVNDLCEVYRNFRGKWTEFSP